MNIFSLHKRQEDLAVSSQPSAVSPGATKLIAYSQVNFKRLITSNYFSVSLYQIPIQSNHSLLNPIFPTFILHLKDAFVHELFVMAIFSGSSSFIEAISSKTKSLNPYAQSEDKTTYTIRIF